MVILPAYYAASLNTDQEQVLQYFIDICQGSLVSYQAKINATSLSVSLTSSQIPILLYNFPANAGGQDISSEVIRAVMSQAPNLCGVKLT
jgi:L-threo-3-deoxy-hexylosonate aldolase